MDTISIIITASGLLGLVITILSLFFDIKPSKREICKKDMVFVIIWLSLAILGLVNLYYIHNQNNAVNKDQSNNNQRINIHETSSSIKENDNDQEIGINNEDTNFSEEELFIQRNFDLIQNYK